MVGVKQKKYLSGENSTRKGSDYAERKVFAIHPHHPHPGPSLTTLEIAGSAGMPEAEEGGVKP
jgi:hypothetical protein